MPDEPEVITNEPQHEPPPPTNEFSRQLEALQAEGATLEISEEGAKPTKEKKAEPEAKEEADTSHIPEELLTKKEEAKKEPEIDYELPKGASEKQKANFALMRKRAEDAAAEAAAARRELEEARKTAPSEQTAAELKKEREARVAAEERLERHAFTESPRYKAFEQTEARALEGAKSYLEGTEIDPNVIDNAARLPAGKRLAALEDAGMTPGQIAAVTPYLATLDNVAREKHEALEHHKEHSAKWQAEERQKAEAAEAQNREERKRLFNELGREMAEKSPAYKAVEGQDAYNKTIEERRAKAERIFFEGTPLERAQAAYDAAEVEFTRAHNERLRGKVATLTAQVQKLTAIQPGAGDGRNGAQSSSSAVAPGSTWSAERAKLPGE